ncbi:hypothetical protein EYF80_056360 [Liparis tanakae]|uniref:Uncharacterized protein n=1 Tax=Liparis tanakae TaxID=230148 RepID=A0A4Z2EXJ3_9TELE|nr:hypothetical protein EYF80_056360 [Liparis tanakae]
MISLLVLRSGPGATGDTPRLFVPLQSRDTSENTARRTADNVSISRSFRSRDYCGPTDSQPGGAGTTADRGLAAMLMFKTPRVLKPSEAPTAPQFLGSWRRMWGLLSPSAT